MGECVTDAVVQSCAALHTDLHLILDGHLASQRPPRMSRGLEPSYESTYQEVHKADFERLRNLVQTPEPGTFMHKDLMWAIQIHPKERRDGSRTRAPVSVAYISWVRVHDFVKGEEARIDGPYKFVCQGSPANGYGKLTFPRWNSYSAVMRCVCNM
jgi:hypothetical protein